jgi:hypothetical protein
MDSRKRSQIVALTVIGLPVGAIALADAFPAEEMRRNLYSDRTACERDYSPEQCSSHGVGLGGSGSAGGWCGPYYHANRSLPAARSDPGPGRTGRVTHTETSMRRGFGSFGRAVHASS